MKLLFSAFLILSINFGVGCKPAAKNEAKSETPDTTKYIVDTTTQDNNIDTTEKKSEEIKDPMLNLYLVYLHEQFDSLPPTFEAKYRGFDIGDYPHIIFETKDGNEYDFGDGANTYGSFKEKDFLAEKSKYEDKKFKVTWEWKMSTFLCCEGEMEEKTAKVPSITNLVLVK